MNMEEVNNQVCRGWQLFVTEYQALEHPTKEQHAQAVARAKECMAALDQAAMSNPSEYVGCTILYANCKQIMRSAKSLEYHTPAEEEGEWNKEKLGPFDDMKLPGQSESWDAKFDKMNDLIIQEFYNTHPDEAALRQQLEQQLLPLEAQLGELKDEKRSKGFFNFSEKREVKERMAPVKDEIKALRGQMGAIEDIARSYASSRLDDLPSYLRLRF